MDVQETDLKLRELFERNAPPAHESHLEAALRPGRQVAPAPVGAKRAPGRAGHGRALRTALAAVGTLVLIAAFGTGVWQATEHVGGGKPIVVITDATSTTVPVGDLRSQVQDGEWELRVDRQVRTAAEGLPTDFLPESAYQPVEVAPTFRVVISDGGAKVLVTGGQGDYSVRGTRTSITGDRIWYDTDAFAGGRFVVWQTASGLQAEETLYGSGRPIIHSYRGRLVKMQTGSGSFDYEWHVSVAAVNALGPTRVTITETRNEKAPGNGSTGQTMAGGPMVTRVEQRLDAPTGRAYQRAESFVDAETVADGAERLTVVQNTVLSSIPPWSRYRHVSLQPPVGLPLPLWAGSAAGQEGYEALLSAIDPVGTTSGKQVEQLAGGRTLLTWEREGDRWRASFSLTLAANRLPDVIIITGETDGEEGRTEYSTRIEYRFDAPVSFSDVDFGFNANPPDPGADEITYELPLANPRSDYAEWGEYWLGPQIGEWRLTAAEHCIHQGSMQAADAFVSLAYTRLTAADSSESIRVEVRPAGAETPSVSRTHAEQLVNAGGWTRREAAVAGGQATVYSGPTEGLGGRIDSLYVFLPDAFVAIDMPNGVDEQMVLDAVTEVLPLTFGPDGRPVYDGSADDWFNAAHSRYFALYMKNYGMSSIGYSDSYVFKAEGLTPDWFGLEVNDLPRVIDRLEAGAWPAYTMSLIMLLTKSDPGVDLATGDGVDHQGEWVQAFNALKAAVATKVEQRDVAALGYLALPGLYDELKTGAGGGLLSLVCDVADGLPGADKVITTGWSAEAWLEWFETNKETLEVLRSVIDREINLPWLE